MSPMNVYRKSLLPTSDRLSMGIRLHGIGEPCHLRFQFTRADDIRVARIHRTTPCSTPVRTLVPERVSGGKHRFRACASLPATLIESKDLIWFKGLERFDGKDG